jgi:hypothetical protein
MTNPYQHQPPTAPWDNEPTGAALLKLQLHRWAYALTALLVYLPLIALCANGLHLSPPEDIFSSKFFLLNLLLITLTGFVLYAAVAQVRRIKLPVNTAHLNELANGQPILFVPFGIFWETDGPSSYSVSDKRIEFSALPRWRNVLFPFLCALQAPLWISVEFTGYSSTIFIILLVLGVQASVAFLFLGRLFETTSKPTHFELLRSEIKRATCYGPILQLHVKAPDFKLMRTVTCYIAEDHREDFFTQFEHTFPGHLPSEYRNALANTTPPTPEDTPNLATAHP